MPLKSFYIASGSEHKVKILFISTFNLNFSKSLQGSIYIQVAYFQIVSDFDSNLQNWVPNHAPEHLLFR